jgi:hypothetical protein
VIFLGIEFSQEDLTFLQTEQNRKFESGDLTAGV